ncbi:hypothetical protein NDA16_004807 [Ustilago loliicola]|nr:hypothetical protein NDA16_004807 [Ustilago loliicola]
MRVGEKSYLSQFLGPSGQAASSTVQGDALKPEDVSGAFSAAIQRFGNIDYVLFSIGGTLVFSRNPLSQPSLSPPSICDRAIHNVTAAILKLGQPQQPRLVVISSNGLGKQGYSYLPYVMRPLYGYLLHEPHLDKEQMESHLYRLAGLQSEDFNPTPDPLLQQQPKIKQLVIVRPALLVNGDATKTFRAEESLQGAYTIRRSDVGHFVYSSVLGGPKDKGQYVGKAVTLAY